nr:hypothetical protein [Armatimonadota bacterium]
MISRMSVAVFAFSLGLVAYAAEARGAPAYTVQMRVLGPVPAAGTIRKEWVTHDGRNVVWRVTQPNGEVVVLNGKADPPVTTIKSGPVVSPDGSRVAYK